MSIFSKNVSYKFKEIPSMPEQTAARARLQDLSQRNLEYPVQQFADMTPEEQTVQNALPDYFNTSQGAYNKANTYYSDILAGKYNPLDSPYYTGFRTNQDIAKKKAQSQVSRSQQASGMFRSGPTTAMAAQVGKEYDANTAMLEGQLLQNERNRMDTAATALPAVENARLSNMGAISDLAARRRALIDARNAAAYNAAISTLLAPYEKSKFMGPAQIALALLNEPRYVGARSGGGVTDLGFMVNAGADFAGSYLRAGGG